MSAAGLVSPGRDDARHRIDLLPRSNVRANAAAGVVLFGTGTVGTAFLQRLARLAPSHDGVRALCLTCVANSRVRIEARRVTRLDQREASRPREASEPREASGSRETNGAREASGARQANGVREASGSPRGARLDPHEVLSALRTASGGFPITSQARSHVDWTTAGVDIASADVDATLAALDVRGGRRIVIDATGSEAIAARHAEWLASGIDVVTASKLATGGTLARWNVVREAAASGAGYGDSATVGAGLPILRTLRELRAGGDAIRAIAGSLSGSLAWLFARHDGRTPFSELVAEARALGYTEPDPRQDLSGDDVRRKLLILARTAGEALEVRDVEVESLAALADADLARRLQSGRTLRYLARWQPGRARIALEALAPDDPLAQGDGCDNRIAIWTDRYRHRPLVLQGPGAGAEVTAAALLDDVLAVLRSPRAPRPQLPSS